jgi:hypothetical protein
MTKGNHYMRQRKDYVADELVRALQAKPTYKFNELFQTVFDALRKRGVSNVGEDMLRLRLYERLQTFVGQGLVKKVDKEYSGVQSAVSIRAAEMAEAAAHRERKAKESPQG